MNDEIRNLLEKWGLAEFEESIQSLMRPAVALTFGEPDSEASIDASKVGGNPALPGVEHWPRKADGQPLDFLAQINFAEVAATLELPNFPKDGLCLFFYDVVDQPGLCGALTPEGYRVLYFPAGTPLVAVDSLSEDRPFGDAPFNSRGSINECSISMAAVEMYPQATSITAKLLSEELGWDRKQTDQYMDFVGDANGTFCQGHYCQHTISGYNNPLQDDVSYLAEANRVNFDYGKEEYDSWRTRVVPGMDRWECLLQLDSDPRGEIDWGDGGRLFFYLQKEDLAACRFDQVFFEAQCC